MWSAQHMLLVMLMAAASIDLVLSDEQFKVISTPPPGVRKITCEGIRYDIKQEDWMRQAKPAFFRVRL
jgi:hypothetical protein